MRRRLAAARFAVVLAVLVAAVVAASAAPAVAQEEADPRSPRELIESAVRAGEPERALVYLGGLTAAATPQARVRCVEAAAAARTLLPPELAAPAAARLLALCLRQDRSDADGAWSEAKELRRLLFDRVDVENGVRFLAALIDIYPETPTYRYDLGLLLLDGGRREEARAVFELLHRNTPADPRPAYRLAELAEDDGDVAAALAYCDAILRARPQELRAHRLRADLLGAPGGDHEAALRAVAEGVRAVEAAPAGPERDRYLGTFEEQRRRITEAADRRRALAALSARTDDILFAVLACWAAAALGIHWALRRIEAVPRSGGLRET